MKSVTLRRPVLRDEMRRYLLAFLLGFGSLLLVILPIILSLIHISEPTRH